jgi:acetyl-CoA carboxylase carboxyl transferase subunit alpha
VGHQKGRTTKEKVRRNFGQTNPEGHRKAIRVFELADRFRLPIFTFIDTPGAYPGLGAEERGQSEAIGHSLATLSRVGVPVIATVIGEGGSGGALALGVANRVLMLEFGCYSVISPEGCAAILWKDGARAPEAAERLRITAPDMLEFDVIDQIVDEPPGGAHQDPDEMARRVGDALEVALASFDGMSPAELRDARYDRFRRLGKFLA